MDCQSVLKHLDCLHDEDPSAVDGDLADHIENCPNCRETLASWRQIDRRIYSAMMSVDVPDGLEERLLTAIAAQESTSQPATASTDAITGTVPERIRRGVSVKALLQWTTALVLVACGLWWMLPARSTMLSYSQAVEALSARLAHEDPHAWQALPDFDDGFDLSAIRHDLSGLRLSQPRGLDLGGDTRQDAAILQFRMKQWQGVIVVLPNKQFADAPHSPAPTLQSGRSTLAWQSADGARTYLCFVHHGSPRGLAEQLFGNWS